VRGRIRDLPACDLSASIASRIPHHPISSVTSFLVIPSWSSICPSRVPRVLGSSPHTLRRSLHLLWCRPCPSPGKLLKIKRCYCTHPWGLQTTYYRFSHCFRDAHKATLENELGRHAIVGELESTQHPLPPSGPVPQVPAHLDKLNVGPDDPTFYSIITLPQGALLRPAARASVPGPHPAGRWWWQMQSEPTCRR
jgi:hypothetical protein